MKNKDKQSKVQIAVGEYGYKSTSNYIERVCPECGETYRRYPDEIEYIFDKKFFCTFPCKNKYRKKHPELDLSESEKIVIRYEKLKEQARKKANEKYNKK